MEILGGAQGDTLIGVAIQDQGWHSNVLQDVAEVRLRECARHDSHTGGMGV